VFFFKANFHIGGANDTKVFGKKNGPKLSHYDEKMSLDDTVTKLGFSDVQPYSSSSYECFGNLGFGNVSLLLST
jgi:hypothetical protein